jgi:hypothetical protein
MQCGDDIVRKSLLSIVRLIFARYAQINIRLHLWSRYPLLFSPTHIQFYFTMAFQLGRNESARFSLSAILQNAL